MVELLLKAIFQKTSNTVHQMAHRLLPTKNPEVRNGLVEKNVNSQV